MIIYGTRNTQLIKEVLTEKCPNCENQASTEMYVYQKYAHIFWIPFFPISKKGISQCDHCKKVYTDNDMPPVLLKAFFNLEKQTKIPKWTFVGLALIGVLIVSVIYSGITDKQNTTKYIKDLKPNDIIEIKTRTAHFTNMKVVAVSADSVDVIENKQEALLRSGLDELGKYASAFSEEVYRLPKTTILKKYEQDTIINVIRSK
jgi:hypothetical protein